MKKCTTSELCTVVPDENIVNEPDNLICPFCYGLSEYNTEEEVNICMVCSRLITQEDLESFMEDDENV
jgi:hypothetical protein